MCKVSVIIPVYNAEHTVCRMLDSLVNQTLRDIEILVIDDGSTDSTPEILDRYSSFDSRVKVFHKENGGVASARQMGIENAKGEYSIHADADDWVELTMIDDMYRNAKKLDADIVISDYYKNKSGDDRSILCANASFVTSPLDLMYDILTGKIFGALWNKMIKMTAINHSHARFIEGVNYSEDVLFLAQILCRINVKIAYVNQSYYHYVMNENSITKSVSYKTFKELDLYFKSLVPMLPNEERFNDIAKTFPLAIFSTGFLNGYFEKESICDEFQKVKHYAYKTNSLRWKLGYFCVEMHLFNIAKKLLTQ